MTHPIADVGIVDHRHVDRRRGRRNGTGREHQHVGDGVAVTVDGQAARRIERDRSARSQRGASAEE